MDTVMIGAFDSGSRTVQLGQTGDVEQFGAAEQIRDFPAHGAAGALRAINDLFDVYFVGDAALMDFLRHQQSHGGG